MAIASRSGWVPRSWLKIGADCLFMGRLFLLVSSAGNGEECSGLAFVFLKVVGECL